MEFADSIDNGGGARQPQPQTLSPVTFMFRGIALLGLAIFAVCSSGCAICCAPYDYDYGAFGGVRPREDMRYGRVGSAIAPAGAGGYIDNGGYIEEEVEYLGDAQDAYPAEGEYIVDGEHWDENSQAPTPAAQRIGQSQPDASYYTR